MSDLNTIQDHLLAYLRDQAGVTGDSIATMDLIADGVLDSLLLTDLVLHIQVQFGVVLQAADVTPDNFRTVVRLAALVQQRQSGKAQAA